MDLKRVLAIVAVLAASGAACDSAVSPFGLEVEREAGFEAVEESRPLRLGADGESR